MWLFVKNHSYKGKQEHLGEGTTKQTVNNNKQKKKTAFPSWADSCLLCLDGYSDVLTYKLLVSSSLFCQSELLFQNEISSLKAKPCLR